MCYYYIRHLFIYSTKRKMLVVHKNVHSLYIFFIDDVSQVLDLHSVVS
jgi:hypothetical protein